MNRLGSFRAFVILALIGLMVLAPWSARDGRSRLPWLPFPHPWIAHAASTDGKWINSYNVQITSGCNGTNCFAAPQGAWESNSTYANVYGVMPTGGTISWTATLSGTAGGTSYAVQLDVNGSNQGTCTITAAQIACISGSVTLAQGDTVAWNFTASGATTTRQVSIYAQWTPTTAGEQVLMGNSRGTNISTNNFGALSGEGVANGTESNVYIINPLSGTTTFKKLCGKQGSAPSGGNTRDLFMTIAGSTTAITHRFTNADGTTFQCDNTNTATSVAGDTLSVKTVLNGAAAASAAWGVVYVPATSGDFMLAVTSGTPMSSASNRYMPLSAYDSTSATLPNSNEDLAKATVSNDIELTALYAKFTAAPGGAGKYWVVNLRKNDANEVNNFRCVVYNAATACNATGGVFVPAANDTLNLNVTPSGTPAGAGGRFSFAATMNFTAPCSTSMALIDWHAGTSGNALAADTNDGITVPLVDSSSYGPTGMHSWINANVTDMSYNTAGKVTGAFSYPTTCPVNYTGSTLVGLQILYSTTGVYGLQWTKPIPPPTALNGTETAAYGFWMKTDALATDVGLNIDVSNGHMSANGFTNVPLGNDGVSVLRIGFETPSNGGCTGINSYDKPVTISTNTWYWISVTITSDTTKSNYRWVYNSALSLVSPGANNPASTPSCIANENFKDLQFGNASGAAVPSPARNVWIGPVVIQYSGATAGTPLLPTAISGGGLTLTGVGDLANLLLIDRHFREGR